LAPSISSKPCSAATHATEIKTFAEFSADAEKDLATPKRLNPKLAGELRRMTPKAAGPGTFETKSYSIE